MTCKGICYRHKFNKDCHGGVYAQGAKRCQMCNINIIWPQLYCPCCGYKLRTKGRQTSSKDYLLKKQSEVPQLQG